LLADPRFGPRWAFGIPGVAMVIATIFFWAGRKKFVHIPPAGLEFLKQMFSREGLGALLRLAIVYVFVAVFWSLWDQSSGGSWTLQAQKMDLSVPWLPWVNIGFSPFHFDGGWGVNLLASQVQTANPILILIFIPLVNYVIYPLIDRFFTLTPLRKIGIGLFLTAASYLVIWQIQQMIDAGAKPNVNWQFLAYVILTLGETMVSITGLEFSYTQAPNKMKSAVMALWLFTVSMGNLFTAAVNYFIRNADGSVKMNDQQYFLFFTMLMLIAAAVFVVMAVFYHGKTYLQSQEKPLEEMEPAIVTEVGMP
jgi:POT family proton-dependent oligopeptide transporter